MAIDLFCGLGGWTEGLLAEGYRVVRLNDGNVKVPTMARLDALVDGTIGKRLTYKALIQ